MNISVKPHYVTCAAFFLKDQADQNPPAAVDCSAGNSLYGKALIRKRCICASDVIFDESLERWVCSTSGAELEVSSCNQEPILPPGNSADALEPHKAQFGNPEREAIFEIDEAGQIQVFVKVPDDQAWVIQDPLPVFDNLTLKTMYTDLILNWSLDVGDFSLGRISVEILLNIIDPVHERVAELLARGTVIGLHFFHAESFLALGYKTIKPSGAHSYIVEHARSVLQALPREPNARETALQNFAETQELSVLAWAESAGLCTEPLYILKQNRLADFKELNLKLQEHREACERCRRILGSKNHEGNPLS